MVNNFSNGMSFGQMLGQHQQPQQPQMTQQQMWQQQQWVQQQQRNQMGQPVNHHMAQGVGMGQPIGFQQHAQHGFQQPTGFQQQPNNAFGEMNNRISSILQIIQVHENNFNVLRSKGLLGNGTPQQPQNFTSGIISNPGFGTDDEDTGRFSNGATTPAKVPQPNPQQNTQAVKTQPLQFNPELVSNNSQPVVNNQKEKDMSMKGYEPVIHLDKLATLLGERVDGLSFKSSKPFFFTDDVVTATELGYAANNSYFASTMGEDVDKAVGMVFNLITEDDRLVIDKDHLEKISKVTPGNLRETFTDIILSQHNMKSFAFIDQLTKVLTDKVNDYLFINFDETTVDNIVADYDDLFDYITRVFGTAESSLAKISIDKIMKSVYQFPITHTLGQEPETNDEGEIEVIEEYGVMDSNLVMYVDRYSHFLGLDSLRGSDIKKVFNNKDLEFINSLIKTMKMKEVDSIVVSSIDQKSYKFMLDIRGDLFVKKLSDF